jgi:hypothetical protein
VCVVLSADKIPYETIALPCVVTDTASNMVYAYSSSPSSPSSSSSLLGGQSLGRGIIVVLIFTLGTMIVNVTAQQSEVCSTYLDSCKGCLENSCAWVPVAGCLESCDVITEDVSCYTSEDFPESITTEEICSNYMAIEASNIKLCNSQTDCTTCLDTTFVDGSVDGGTTTTTNTCKWFQFDCCIESYCGHECDGMGCGALTCDAVAVNVDDNDNENDQIIINNDCDRNLSCRNCLSTRQIGPTAACGWVNGMGCVESCNNIIAADVGYCYDIENFKGNGVVMTGDDICTVAGNNNIMADMNVCSIQTECTTCIETSFLGYSSQLDPNSNTAAKSCRWFSDMNFCGSEWTMIGCGELTCDAVADIDIFDEDLAVVGNSTIIEDIGVDEDIMDEEAPVFEDDISNITMASTEAALNTFTPTTFVPTTWSPTTLSSYTPLSTVLKFRPPSSSPSSVDAVKSSTAAKNKSNYFLVWTATATATLMVVVASCLL